MAQKDTLDYTKRTTLDDNFSPKVSTMGQSAINIIETPLSLERSLNSGMSKGGVNYSPSEGANVDITSTDILSANNKESLDKDNKDVDASQTSILATLNSLDDFNNAIDSAMQEVDNNYDEDIALFQRSHTLMYDSLDFDIDSAYTNSTNVNDVNRFNNTTNPELEDSFGTIDDIVDDLNDIQNTTITNANNIRLSTTDKNTINNLVYNSNISAENRALINQSLSSRISDQGLLNLQSILDSSAMSYLDKLDIINLIEANRLSDSQLLSLSESLKDVNSCKSATSNLKDILASSSNNLKQGISNLLSGSCSSVTSLFTTKALNTKSLLSNTKMLAGYDSLSKLGVKLPAGTSLPSKLTGKPAIALPTISDYTKMIKSPISLNNISLPKADINNISMPKIESFETLSSLKSTLASKSSSTLTSLKGNLPNVNNPLSNVSSQLNVLKDTSILPSIDLLPNVSFPKNLTNPLSSLKVPQHLRSNVSIPLEMPSAYKSLGNMPKAGGCLPSFPSLPNLSSFSKLSLPDLSKFNLSSAVNSVMDKVSNFNMTSCVTGLQSKVTQTLSGLGSKITSLTNSFTSGSMLSWVTDNISCACGCNSLSTNRLKDNLQSFTNLSAGSNSNIFDTSISKITNFNSTLSSKCSSMGSQYSSGLQGMAGRLLSIMGKTPGSLASTGSKLLPTFSNLKNLSTSMFSSLITSVTECTKQPY